MFLQNMLDDAVKKRAGGGGFFNTMPVMSGMGVPENGGGINAGPNVIGVPKPSGMNPGGMYTGGHFSTMPVTPLSTSMTAGGGIALDHMPSAAPAAAPGGIPLGHVPSGGIVPTNGNTGINGGGTGGSGAVNQGYLDDLQRRKNAATPGTDEYNRLNEEIYRVMTKTGMKPGNVQTGSHAGDTGTTGDTTGTTGGDKTGGTTNPSTGTGNTPMVQYSNEYMEKAGKLMTQLETMMNTPFKFDPTTDQSYLAAQQLARAGAKTASSSAMETMNDRGITNSSVTSSQLGQIAQQAEMEPLRLLPQLESQAYSQYQNGIGNMSNLMNSYLNTGQNQLQFGLNKALQESIATGKYLPPELQLLLNQATGGAPAAAPGVAQVPAAVTPATGGTTGTGTPALVPAASGVTASTPNEQSAATPNSWFGPSGPPKTTAPADPNQAYVDDLQRRKNAATPGSAEYKRINDEMYRVMHKTGVTPTKKP